MKKFFPHFSYKINTDQWGIVSFIGKLRPHDAAPEYLIKVNYRLWRNPRVYILDPSLVEKPPHFYSKTRSLCLYHTDEFAWQKSFSIAEYIVPWASAWLYFYEVWKETGVWYGAEAPHDLKKEKEQTD